MPIYASQGQYINGTWQRYTGTPFESLNPALQACIWQGHMADLSCVEHAFSAAHNALPKWYQLPLQKRISYLKDFIHHLTQSLPTLVTQLSMETGKPLWESQQELKGLNDKLNLAIEAYEQRTGEQRIEHAESTLHIRFKPIGVVVVLGAFNLPIHLSHGHILPALLAGNTVIFKPSELTPAIAEWVMNCWHAAKLPKGVLNLIQGDGETASHLLKQPINGVYFTGSYPTGSLIQTNLQSRPDVLLALEMGGNNPLIIEQVKQEDAAIYQALLSCFITAGQRCSCTRRLMLPNTQWGDRFLKRFITQAQQLRVGPYTDQPEPFMGPVIRQNHAMKHLEQQQDRIDSGAMSLLKMSLKAEQGAFLTPGVLDMQHAQTIKDEEIFAPLVQVYRYHSFEEAVTLANQTQYGLTAGLFSDDATHFAYFAEHIRAGVLTWNRPTAGASSRLPFGGIGKSGNYRPSGFFAADYCAYPVASVEQETLSIPATPLPGVPNEKR